MGAPADVSRPWPPPTAAIRRHPFAAQVTLTLALSWGYWIPVAAAGGATSHFPGLLGPMLAGLLVTAATGGRTGLRRLGASMLRWRVAPRWYLAALLPVLAAAAALAGLALTGRAAPSAAGLAAMPGLPEAGWPAVFALVLVVNGYGEEVGWRGVAWPLLRERHSPAGAALLLTVPWAVWHLPTFWLDTGMALEPLVLPGWLVGLFAGAVVLGWLMERTGSLLIVALFHAMLNMASATRGTESVAAAAAAAVIVWAVLLLRGDVRRR